MEEARRLAAQVGQTAKLDLFQPGGQAGPRERSRTSTGPSGFDEFVSDPAKPVPSNPDIAIGMTREYMVDDQRFAARRPDVLVYQTEPLEAEVTLAGPIRPETSSSRRPGPTPTGSSS